MYRITLTVLLILSVATLAWAQAPACPSGTLANVIGTSCTIGNLTFTFQNNFQGFYQTVDLNNNINTVFFGPETIPFSPVNSGGQAGFVLTPNFVESPGTQGLEDSHHNISFSYSVQVNGSFEILGENSTIVGTVPAEGFFASIEAFDEQCFPNQGCLFVSPGIDFSSTFGFSSNPVSSAILTFPGLGSTGQSGLSFTTALNSFAFTPSEAILNSVNFLYTVAPQIVLPPAQLVYKNVDLPGELSTFVISINDTGAMVGSYLDGNGTSHSFITNKDGFDTIDFPGSVGTFAEGVNNRGDIVGAYDLGDGVIHGFLFSQGSFTTVDFPGAIFNAANEINDAGEITGLFQSADGNVHAYTFQAGVFTAIDHPTSNPFLFTESFGINDRGDLVGEFVDSNINPQAFVLSQGMFLDFGVPGATTSFGEGINDSGDVVGGYTDLGFLQHGFVRQGGAFATVDFPGGNSTQPTQINALGEIVGTYGDASGAFHSFLARRLNPGEQFAPPVGAAPSGPSVRRCSMIERIQHPERLKNPMGCPAQQ